MRKPGKGSRARDTDFYSDHKHEKDKYFFKVLAGDFRERLAIPDKFEKHFRGLIAKSVKLESRCGHTFDVEVAKNMGKVILQTGWKEFVPAHDLSMGDFLVFKYDGTRFKVLIFDLSCCEKVPPCLVKRNHICGRETRGMHTEISSSCEDLPMNVTATSSTSLSESSGDSISPEDQKSHYVPGYFLPRGTSLTCVQMKQLKERVRASTSTVPIYGCIINKSNLRRGKSQAMEIPRVYADVYLPFDDQTLMLQCCGKSWEVRCAVRSNRRTKILSQGWKLFARDNKLQLGDLCLFELLENTKYTMNVRVIRAGFGVVKLRKPGKRSRERDVYFYSDYKDEKNNYFFKVLAGDFRERLAIPDKFVQHFRGLIANSVKLESRCGHTFDVEVAKNLGKVVLQTGWKDFVAAHDLNMGDFLVFKYDGTSRLKVFIFDVSCCEKLPPCLVKKNHICGKGTREMHIEISSSCEDLPMNVTASSSTMLSDSSGNSICPEVQKSHCVPGYILPQGTRLTCVQMKKLKQRVRASSSTIPIYGCIIKKSNLRRGKSQSMDIPRKYADVYLPFDENQTLMLQCCGKSWKVWCVIQKGRRRRSKGLSQGWKQFAHDNKLQLGDLCLFELLENKKYTMNVHIIHAK